MGRQSSESEPVEAEDVDSAGVYLDLRPEDLNYGNLKKVGEDPEPARSATSKHDG